MLSHLIETVVVALKKTLNISEQSIISPVTKLRDDLGLDSMTSLTFLLTLEDMLAGFVVDPEKLDMSDLDSVQSVATYIQREMGEVAYAG